MSHLSRDDSEWRPSERLLWKVPLGMSRIVVPRKENAHMPDLPKIMRWRLGHDYYSHRAAIITSFATAEPDMSWEHRHWFVCNGRRAHDP